MKAISSFFSFKDRSATFKKEIIGGISTFIAMAYILAVNPAILSDSNFGQGKSYAGVFFLATAISAFVSTLAMGVIANVPIALAPGMGVNSFFAYTVASSMLGLTIGQALVCTFVSGILYAIITLTPLRIYIAKLLPRNIKLAIGAMIGLFLAYIGLVDSGIITSGAMRFPVPDQAGNPIWVETFGTATKLGNFADPFVIIALVTLGLVFILHFMKVKGAVLIAMIASVCFLAIAYGAGVGDAGNAFKLRKWDEFDQFDNLANDMWTSFGSTLSNGKAYIAIFVFLYVDFFDTTGTLFSVGEQANLNEKNDKWLQKANIVDAGGTVFGSIMLTSTVTSYVESSVGVSQGARTGFSSIVVATLFALSIAIWPIMNPLLPIVHSQDGVQFGQATIMPVTGPILVMVGSLMIAQLKHFNWSQTIDIPVLFVTLVFGMLSYSISTGIAAGIIIYYLLNFSAYIITIIKSAQGKIFEVNDEEIPHSSKTNKIENKLPDLKKRVINPLMIGLFLLAIAYFATLPLYAY